MRSKKLVYRLMPFYGLVVLAVTSIILYIALYGINALNYEGTQKELTNSANLALEIFKLQNEREELDEFCLNISELTNERITVVNSSGRVLGDSDTPSSEMEDHGDRPEINDAIDHGFGVSERFSHTVGKTMLYVAVPHIENGQVVHIIRTARPLLTIKETIYPQFNRLLLFAIVLIIAALIVNVFITRKITVPLKMLQDGAENIIKGKFELPYIDTRILEFNNLASKMDNMARELEGRIATISQKNNEQQALLSSMIEGVLAFDINGRLIRMNKSAATFLNTYDENASGKLIPEIIRNSSLLEFTNNLVSKKVPMEDEIEIIGLDIRHVMVHGSPMFLGDGTYLGIVIVLNDITRLKNLEKHRRDFIGNVAHEIRTPLTSIKGATETLLSGEVNNEVELKKFLDIIERQSTRLSNIIEDMIRLSSIEEQRDQSKITMEEIQLKVILDGAIRDCTDLSKATSTKITLNCDESIQIVADGELLRQAFKNLIENAIKYGDTGNSVLVEAEKTADTIYIHIIDKGIGISRVHIPRLFERFYRIDEGRSRNSGGTGLGLAIVKHIVLAHSGTIDVKSKEGEGTTFTVGLTINSL